MKKYINAENITAVVVVLVAFAVWQIIAPSVSKLTTPLRDKLPA